MYVCFLFIYLLFVLESPPANNLVDTSEDKKEDGLWNDENNGDAVGDDEESKAFYNKDKSFFDNISCESVERSKG